MKPRAVPKTRLAQDEVELSRIDEPGISVILKLPDDLDFLADIDAGRLTIANAIKHVATRRQLERESEGRS